MSHGIRSSIFTSPVSRPCRTLPVAGQLGGKKHARLLLAVLTWYGMHGQAHAEPGRIEIGAKLAPSWENHAGEREFAENTFKQGISAGAGLRYGLLGSWSGQLEFLYATRGTGVEADGRVLAQYNFTYLEFPLLGRFTRRLPVLASDDGRLPLSGYVIVGPALSYLIGAEEIDEGETLELPRDALHSVDLTVIAGIGAAWELTPQWTASFELRYDRGFRDAFSTGVESSNQAILLSFGIDYTLNDSDGDGMPNGRDQCRLAAEDRNGHKDTDGCPDANDDDDKDGVVFSADACPEQQEDKDDFEDEDGCPEPDNDGDGLADADDRCPNEAFSYNMESQHDRRGCPPKLQYVTVGSDRLEPAVQFVQFKTEFLDERQTEILDEVAVLLTDYYPNMRLRLEGHADGDDRGARNTDDAERLNQLESERRAQAVVAYLIEKGIDRQRLVEKGFGNDKPISREETDEGRARNRRVELVIIENPLPPVPASR